MSIVISEGVNGVVIFVTVLTAICTLFSGLFAVYRWYLRQQAQDREIDRIKEENTLIVYALFACLDGLHQLGANHTVSTAKEKLDKYINKKAHE